MTNKDNEDLKRQAMDNTLGLNPVIGIRGKDILSAARTVMIQAIKQPFLSAKHVAHFSLELKNVVLGQSPMEPQYTTALMPVSISSRPLATSASKSGLRAAVQGVRLDCGLAGGPTQATPAPVR